MELFRLAKITRGGKIHHPLELCAAPAMLFPARLTIQSTVSLSMDHFRVWGGTCCTEPPKGKRGRTSPSPHEIVTKGFTYMHRGEKLTSRDLPDLGRHWFPNLGLYQFFYSDLSELCVISSHFDI